MKNKDISRQLAEINNLILRQKLSLSTHHKSSDEPHDVSCAGSCIIAYLYDHSKNDVFQRDLEHEFFVRRSTMSKVLTSLEQKGYIERIAVESDHRLRKISLTQKACNVIDKIKTDRQNLEEQLTHNIGEEELNNFRQTLQKIKSNLSQEE